MTDPKNHDGGAFWVFGYGSLMWRPGFAFAETRPARVLGYHRAMCVLSVRYRGTPETPGLVMGLKAGGECLGRAYRVAPGDRTAAVAYLKDRELVTGVYTEQMLPAVLDDGRRVQAYGFVADPGHPQYRGALSQAEAAALIRQGRGWEGPARDYLANSLAHLAELGIEETDLAALLAAVDAEPLEGQNPQGDRSD